MINSLIFLQNLYLIFQISANMYSLKFPLKFMYVYLSNNIIFQHKNQHTR